MARNYKTKLLKNYSQAQMDEALECVNNHNERPSDVLKNSQAFQRQLLSII